MNRILLIDNDVEFCAWLSDYLQPKGFDVETVHEAQRGVTQAISGKHDLVLLEVMMPRWSGFDVLRRIRVTSSIPVLMVSARGEDIDRIIGLEMGADDYLRKPFNPQELLARIRAIQRRMIIKTDAPKQGDQPNCLKVGDVRLDLGSRSVELEGRNVNLTDVEFTLLYELIRKAGQVVSRDEIATVVLGRSFSVFDRSIDVHVCSLRKKLGHEMNGRERIKSVRGVGYLYARMGELA